MRIVVRSSPPRGLRPHALHRHSGSPPTSGGAVVAAVTRGVRVAGPHIDLPLRSRASSPTVFIGLAIGDRSQRQLARAPACRDGSGDQQRMHQQPALEMPRTPRNSRTHAALQHSGARADVSQCQLPGGQASVTRIGLPGGLSLSDGAGGGGSAGWHASRQRPPAPRAAGDEVVASSATPCAAPASLGKGAEVRKSSGPPPGSALRDHRVAVVVVVGAGIENALRHRVSIAWCAVYGLCRKYDWRVMPASSGGAAVQVARSNPLVAKGEGSPFRSAIDSMRTRVRHHRRSTRLAVVQDGRRRRRHDGGWPAL